MFHKKLKLLRKNNNFTQEKLAELIEVSRQTIAKWEVGLILPDIDNLLRLSTLFNVTIDFLVKDPELCSINETEKYEPNTDISTLTRFLYVAKSNTYASGVAAEINKNLPLSKTYFYELEPYKYQDVYIGNTVFFGNEQILKNNEPIWQMNYSGKVMSSTFSSSFLKNSLLLLPQDLPLRGPIHNQKGQYVYHCHINGDVTWFEGKELIFYENTLTFELLFSGGLIK